MKRIVYLLRDPSGRVMARMVLPEQEPVPLEPWMVHNINRCGWQLVTGPAEESGVEVHGWADWRTVAQNMAGVLELLLDDFDFTDEALLSDTLTHARSVLDDYRVAEMEVSVAEDIAEVEEGDGDGQT